RTAPGLGKASFIDAPDIAAAAAALTRPGNNRQIYALIGPEPLSIKDCLAILEPEMDRTISYSALTGDEFRSMMIGFGLPADFTDVVVRDQLAI
ncbi:MAG: hypothetical protein MO852_13595, partial [Candidatus Devosia euplotis]|nr:hypothetical protein [Candidatus Devosia euplotis]